MATSPLGSLGLGSVGRIASTAFRARRRPILESRTRSVVEGDGDIPDETPPPPDYDARREDEPAVPEPSNVEPIPFRLEKKNVFPSWFHVNMKIPSAVVSEDAVIPHWVVQGMIPYPFWGISGGSLSDGLAATKHFEKGFSRDTHRAEKKTGATTEELFSEMRSKFPDTITTSDVVFKPVKAISAKPSGKKAALSVLGDHHNNYENVREDLAFRQLYDIGSDGRIFANPEQRGRIVFTPNRRKERDLCTLVRISRFDIANECGIFDPSSCIDFLQGVKYAIEANTYGHENIHSLTRGGVNPTFGNYGVYFRSLGCVKPDGKVDMEAYISLVRTGKLNPTKVIEQLVIPFLFPADFNRTYVWVPIGSSRIPSSDASAVMKSAEIFRRLQAGEKPVISTAGEGEGAEEGGDDVGGEETDASESAVTEAIKGLADEVGDIVGDTWKEKFFFSMVSAKQQASRKVVTFLTKGRGKVATILHNEVLVRGRPQRADRMKFRENGNVTREFIVIDSVRDSRSGLDFTPFFRNKDPKIGGILDQKAVKKFLFKVISGVCVSFPVDLEIEAGFGDFRQHRQKVDNVWRYGQYCDKYAVKVNDLQSFYITLMCPAGSGDNPDAWFMFNSYQESGNHPSQNVAVPDDLVDALSSVLPNDEHPLKSVMWYNEVTSKDTGKINFLTNGRSVERAASGRVIGATDR